jgi:hypothetical protein
MVLFVRHPTRTGADDTPIALNFQVGISEQRTTHHWRAPGCQPEGVMSLALPVSWRTKFEGSQVMEGRASVNL